MIGVGWVYLFVGGEGVSDVFVGGGGVEAGGLLGGLRLVFVKNSVIFVWWVLTVDIQLVFVVVIRT